MALKLVLLTINSFVKISLKWLTALKLFTIKNVEELF